MITPFIYKRTIIRITKSTGREVDISRIMTCVPHQDILIIVESGVHVIVYDRRFCCSHRFSFFRSICMHVCNNAHVTYIDQHSAGDEFSVVSIRADANSTILYQGLYVGICQTKMIFTLELSGKGAHGDIRVGSVAKGKSRHMITSVQYHTVSHTTSNYMVKSVLYDDACVGYDGMIHIGQCATKSVAHQSHKSLLVGDHVFSTASPKLEVFTDDVDCGHGSAIGQLDDEQLFYIQCRGVTGIDARRLLIVAFFGDLYADTVFLNTISNIVF